MRLKRLKILFCVLASPFFYSFAPQPEWKLVWSDEFDKPGPPEARNWKFENGFVRNHELQWYQPQNAYCKDGLLTIEARKEKHRNPDYQPGSPNWNTSRETAEYTSSSILTKGLQEWRYGRFEMRARIDTRPGLWPAFWTLGVSGPWPSNGEIDIMEYYRNMLLANVAWASATPFKPVWRTVKKPLPELGSPAWPNQFHVWRMDWDEASIKLFVDEILMNSVDLSQTANGGGTGKNPFHQAHYIVLNLAIGGDNGGHPESTAFPARFEVDYIRVYRKLR